MQSVNDYSQTNEMPQEIALAEILPAHTDRRTAFRAWLATSELTITILAARLGITQATLSQALARDRIPVRHFKMLVDSGVPSQLLPRPEDVRSGPKPGFTPSNRKWQTPVTAAE